MKLRNGTPLPRVLCDLCKQRPATVLDVATRVPPEKLLGMGLSPEAARKIWACEPCVQDLGK